MKISPSKTINELVTALSYIIDTEGNKKYFHAWRVAVLTAKFSKNLDSRRRKEIFYACLLHDAGAVGLSRHIIHFLKQEAKKQQDVLLSHPIIGAQLVSMVPRMNLPAMFILNHHEWINGLGYPRGKSARNIPLGAQLIRVADSIDIFMRNKQYQTWNRLKAKINGLADKQISKEVAKSAVRGLEKQEFFPQVLNHNNITELFYKIKNSVGQIYIAKGIDAIGITLEVTAQIIDMKHPFTAGHSTRVARYAMAIALAMKLKHDEVTCIRWAGLIHDIGKLAIPRRILDKPTELTKEEFTHVKKHPQVTHKILDMVPTLKHLVPIAAGHHEYYNGSGYPLGLKAKDSHLGARILTVCDAFDAMTSNRPYRTPYTPKQACRCIQKLSGRQFDPQITKVAVNLFKKLSV